MNAESCIIPRRLILTLDCPPHCFIQSEMKQCHEGCIVSRLPWYSRHETWVPSAMTHNQRLLYQMKTQGRIVTEWVSTGVTRLSRIWEELSSSLKVYWGVEVWPRILDFGTRWRWVVSFTIRPLYPQGKNPWYYCIGAGWAPEPIWAWWWREIFADPGGTRTPDHPALYHWAICSNPAGDQLSCFFSVPAFECRCIVR